jgi:hypothetical protein
MPLSPWIMGSMDECASEDSFVFKDIRKFVFS